MIPYVLTAVLAASAGWCAGHRTARVRIVFIGGTEQQDAAAVDAAHQAFIAHTRRRFDEMVAGLDLDTPDQEQQ
ncbi:hypothetical protein ACFV20_19390 [Streptomyces sp. NPDC059696]|uniref:hypothetical protein n=1 Tax=Streptomyces sp. NPDC059696 TaxID=3346911 RepID=UPI0036BE0936